MGIASENPGVVSDAGIPATEISVGCK